MIDRPKGITITAREGLSVLDVEASSDRVRLWYPVLGCVVPFASEVAIACDKPANLFRAQCFAATVREHGYSNVTVNVRRDQVASMEAAT